MQDEKEIDFFDANTVSKLIIENNPDLKEKITGRMYKCESYPVDIIKAQHDSENLLRWKEARARQSEQFEKTETNLFSPCSIWVHVNSKEAKRQRLFDLQLKEKMLVQNPNIFSKINEALFANFGEVQQENKILEVLCSSLVKEYIFICAERIKFYAAGIKLEDKDAYIIAEVLKSENSFRRINLGGNEITDMGAKALIEALNNKEQKVHLILSRNRIEDCVKLASLIQNSNLSVNLSNQKGALSNDIRNTIDAEGIFKP